jgi:sulfonate transport system permease protein
MKEFRPLPSPAGLSNISVLGFIPPLLVILLWFSITNFGEVPETILPHIGRVKKAMIDLVSSGQLARDLRISFTRVLRGYGVSILAGGILGILMGMSIKIRNLFNLTVTAMRQIPMIAWIPIIILWCGIGDVSKIVIILLSAVFPIILNTENGINSTPETYIEVARLYKLNKWQTFCKVYLPHALPQIFVGLKLGLGASWMAVVASELIAATTGIGYRMAEARSLMRSDIVIVCMVIIGMVGILMDKILGLLFSAITPWEKEKTEKESTNA